MAKRKIVKVGDDVLRKECREVTVFDDKLRELLDDMAETMYSANGVGLAGPQVGLLKQVAVVDTDGKLYKIVNPKITFTSGEQIDYEGCLSVPNENGKVNRPNEIVVECMDENGKQVKIEAEGYLARAFCHEIDHLHGILFIDKVIEED